MPDENSRSPRRRPVDVLFGEEVELKPQPTVSDAKTPAAQTPGYMVEAPRPVTNLRPPPPEFPNDWRATTPPEAVTVIEPPMPAAQTAESIAPPPTPVMTEPQVETIAEAVTFTVPQRVEPPVEPKPAPAPEPAPPPAPIVATVAQPAPVYGQPELVELSQFVDQLYQNVADETSDSAALNAECLAKLNTARAAIEHGEYAPAETAAEQVKARLLLARTSRAAAHSTNTRLVLVWLIAALVGGLVLFLLPFAARLVPAIIPLVRGIAMGMLGGAVAALWSITHNISARTFEPNMLLKFGIAPLLGAAFGAVLYLLSLLGILAAPGALGIPGEPWLMYLFAFLVGLSSASVMDAFFAWRKSKRA